MDFIYVVVQYFLDMFGGVIPEGDMPVFVTTMSLAGWMVAVDACLFMIACFMHVKRALWLPIIFMITITHAVAGYLGLGMLVTGVAVGATLWILLAFTSWMGLRFIVAGLTGDEDGDPVVDAMTIAGIVTLGAIGLFWAVSFDELFAVLQRYQWMVAQGWNEAAMAVNIGLSMVVLFVIQCGVASCLILAKPITNWFDAREDGMMFVVFGLIMYYLVRGIIQNGLGYLPFEIPYTGISPELLALGFVLTWLLQKALNNESFADITKKALYIKDDEEEAEEAVAS